MEPIDPVLHAFAQARATRVGEGTGLGGRQRPVWLSPEGVAFCGCPGWIRSPRRPRTCTHIHSVVEDGLLPSELEMSEDDVKAEAKFMRQKEPSAETVIDALRESRSGKKFPDTKAALDVVSDEILARAVSVVTSQECAPWWQLLARLLTERIAALPMRERPAARAALSNFDSTRI